MAQIILPKSDAPQLTRVETIDLMMRFVALARAYERDSETEMDEQDLVEAAREGYDIAVEHKLKGGKIYAPH